MFASLQDLQVVASDTPELLGGASCTAAELQNCSSTEGNSFAGLDKTSADSRGSSNFAGIFPLMEFLSLVQNKTNK